MTLNMNPTIPKMCSETVPKKQLIPRQVFCSDVSKFMPLRILEIDEKRDTVDNVYIFKFFVTHPCKPPENPKNIKYDPQIFETAPT